MSFGRFGILTVALLTVCARHPLAAQTLRFPDGQGRLVERRCQPAAAPKKLASLDVLVDSVAVMERLTRESPGDSGTLVLSISFAENGAVRAVRVLEPSTSSPTVAALARVVQTSARTQSPGQLWAARIRVARRPAPSVTVERSVYCPPQFDPTGPRQSTTMVQVNPGDRMPPPGQRLRTNAEVTISETGVPIEVRLIERSGLRDLDDAMVVELQTRRFLPALLDGEPVPSWLRTNGQKLQL